MRQYTYGKHCVRAAAVFTAFFTVVQAGPARAEEKRSSKVFKYTDPFVFEFGGHVTIGGTTIGSDEKYFYVGFEPIFSSFLVKGFQIGGGPILFFDYKAYPDPASATGQELVEKPLGGGLNLLFTYVFDLDHAIFPFLGLGQGFAFAEELETDVNQNRFFVGPNLGIKIIFRENGILSIFFRYQFTSTGYENTNDRVERHDFFAGTGFGFWL